MLIKRSLRAGPKRERSLQESALELAPPCLRYLAYEGPVGRPEAIPGLGHQMCNLLCLFEEAKHLGRIAILPTLYISPNHNNGRFGRSRFEKYLDFSGLLPEVEVLSSEAAEHMKFVSRTTVDSARSTESLAGEEPQLLIRGFPDWNWFSIESQLPVALGEPDGTSRRWQKTFAYDRLRPSRRVSGIADEVKARLGKFAALHLRRGDRARDPEWDAATRPEAILERLRRWIPPGTPLYVLTNERAPGFFDEIRKEYPVATHAHFPKLRALIEEEHDNYMLFSVESELMRRAFFAVGTEAWKGPVLTPYSLLGTIGLPPPEVSL